MFKNLQIGTEVRFYLNKNYLRGMVVEQINSPLSKKPKVVGYVILEYATGVVHRIHSSRVKWASEDYNTLSPWVVEYWRDHGRIQVRFKKTDKVGFVSKYVKNAGIAEKFVPLEKTLRADYKPADNDDGYEIRIIGRGIPSIHTIDELESVKFFSHEPDSPSKLRRIINYIKFLFV